MRLGRATRDASVSYGLHELEYADAGVAAHDRRVCQNGAVQPEKLLKVALSPWKHLRQIDEGQREEAIPSANESLREPCDVAGRSAAPRSRVLVVMDQCTRRIVGFGVHRGVVDGVALCQMSIERLVAKRRRLTSARTMIEDYR